MSIAVLILGIVGDYNAAEMGGPFLESLLLIFGLALLFVNEGYQVGIIGVKNMDESEMSAFPRAQKIRSLIFPSENLSRLPRLFLGQSFLVVLATFLISQITTFTRFPTISGCPEWLVSTVFRSGLPGIVVCVNLAQLLPSILAQKNPRHFLQNTPLVFSVVTMALFIESIGIVHCTFLIVEFFKWTLFKKKALASSDSLAVNSVKGGEEGLSTDLPEQSGRALLSGPDNSSSSKIGASANRQLESSTSETNEQDFMYKLRCCISLLLTLACAAYLCYNVTSGRSSVPLPALLLFLIIALTYIVVFYCEGLKIAIVSTSHLSRDEFISFGHPAIIYDVLQAAGGDSGVSKFLLGRQMLVVPCGFIISNVYLFKSYEYLDDFSHFCLIGLGLPGMLVTMQLVQLAPQVLSGQFMREFLNLPCASSLVYFAVLVEKLGLTQSAYLITELFQSPRSLTTCCDQSKSNAFLLDDIEEKSNVDTLAMSSTAK